MTITTPIISSKQIFAKKTDSQQELDLKAICIFMATGFFMGEDTYWKNKICLLPAHHYKIDTDGNAIKKKPYFKWHYTPSDKSFETTLEEYIQLLTSIIKRQVGNNTVILPLSGGLDSRSQASVLKQLPNKVKAFSYAFKDGYPENRIAKKIAEECDFDFQSFKITSGYLWETIEDLARINGCYSEFTHPRQMAVLPQLKAMDGVFSLGHWGDVLFDRGAPEHTKASDIVALLFKKMIKPKGLELGEQLWKAWGFEGDLKTYLISRIKTDLAAIKIENVSAKVRAYKTTQWAHRWTNTNLSVFETANPITLPYYDNQMCEFVCSTPEAYLSDRRLQLAHLQKDRQLSKIIWQDHTPFNITNYHYNKMPYNLPYRVYSKLKREGKALLKKPYIQRNWELQFVGPENEKHLELCLFNKGFNQWIPKTIVESVYKQFQTKDPIHYAHPVSMLLTLSMWYQNHYKSS